MSQMLKYIVAILGEALVITGFIVFSITIPVNVLVLNIIVASLIYGLMCSFLFLPMVDLKDRAQRSVGGLGLRLTSVAIYALLAIAIMVTGYVALIAFKYQLIAQLVALFVLLVYMMASSTASDKTANVYREEKTKQSGVKAMRSATARLVGISAETPGLPLTVTDGVRELNEELGYVSPNADTEAIQLEAQYMEAVEDMGRALRFYDQEPDRVIVLMERCRRVLARRKSYLS